MSKPEKKAVDAWLAGKPATVRFITAEYREDGTIAIRASSDEYGDEGPWATGRTHAEALERLEARLATKLFP